MKHYLICCRRHRQLPLLRPASNQRCPRASSRRWQPRCQSSKRCCTKSRLTHYRRQTGLFERCGHYSPTACKLHTPVRNFRIVNDLTEHLLSTIGIADQFLGKFRTKAIWLRIYYFSLPNVRSMFETIIKNEFRCLTQVVVFLLKNGCIF